MDSRAAWPFAFALVCACAQGGTIAGDPADLPCKPFETRACPCLGGERGRQMCARSGLAFGVCHGCPSDAATSLADIEDGGTLDPGGALPGTACGVGLPRLCAPDHEKCCVRSLSIDTCIADDAACSCDLDQCYVTEMRCDGPEDCAPGESCCGTVQADDSGGSHYASFACAAGCNNEQNVACHQGETKCAAGRICANSQLLTNLQICVDPASLAQ